MSAARRRFEWQLSSPSNLKKQHFDYNCHPPFADMLLQSISLQHNRRDSSMQNILFGYEFLRTHGSHLQKLCYIERSFWEVLFRRIKRLYSTYTIHLATTFRLQMHPTEVRSNSFIHRYRRQKPDTNKSSSAFDNRLLIMHGCLAGFY